MQYIIKCERCGRPASIEKREVDEKQKKIHTVYKSRCQCGGKVMSLME